MRHLTLLLALLFGMPTFAQSDTTAPDNGPLTFTLEEAEKFALENSYSVTDKELEFQKARRTIRETAARGLPQITGSFNYQYNPQIQQTPIPLSFITGNPDDQGFTTVEFGVAHTNVATLNYNQLLLDGSYFIALQAVKVFKEAANVDVERTKLDIVKNTAQAYYGVLVAQESEEILRENLGSLQKQLFETRQLFENGFVEEQDVDQLELLVNNLDNNLQNSARQAELAKMLLNFNLGLPVRQEIVLTSALEEVMVPEETTLQSETFNYENHVDFRYVDVQRRGASLNVSNEKAKWFPTLSGFIRHQQNNFGNEFSEAWQFDDNNGWIPSTAIGVGLNWNLLQGLSRPATIQKAKLDLQRAEVASELTKNQLLLNYNQAKSNYTFALDNYNNAKKNLDISKKIRDKERIKYSEGLSSSLNLTQAENQYLETQQNYIQALQQVLNAKENLESALGKTE